MAKHIRTLMERATPRQRHLLAWAWVAADAGNEELAADILSALTELGRI